MKKDLTLLQAVQELLVFLSGQQAKIWVPKSRLMLACLELPSGEGSKEHQEEAFHSKVRQGTKRGMWVYPYNVDYQNRERKGSFGNGMAMKASCI